MERKPDSLNDQVNAELQASYLYLAMSAYCEQLSLPGFAHWLREQAREELLHGMHFFDFIVNRGGLVALRPIEAPPSEFGSLLELYEHALENERMVTRSIYDLYERVERERDYAAHTLLEHFASEQMEEERTVEYIVESLKRIGDDGTGLFILDRELASRSPSTTQQPEA